MKEKPAWFVENTQKQVWQNVSQLPGKTIQLICVFLQFHCYKQFGRLKLLYHFAVLANFVILAQFS